MDWQSQLQIDQCLRNTNNPKNPEDQFGRFFRFSDGKGINNTAGFRPKSKANGDTDIEACAFCVLVTNFQESEWPDSLDRETGLFTYYGDNRRAGLLHETPNGGNRLLSKAYTSLHTGIREAVPPFLVFEKFKKDAKTFMRFLGLAAPGAQGLSAFEDLVAVWRVSGATRFQNYRSIFTIFKEESVLRAWLDDLVNGIEPRLSRYCPISWGRWVQGGLYTPLICTRTREPRSRKSQTPHNDAERRVLELILSELNDREFEFAAVEIIRLMDERFSDFTVTQRVRDRGRDALGYYNVGHEEHQIRLSAIVEAKQWRGVGDVGVKPMARLLSRLRHRDIGVFLTTSCFNKQVQEELIEDRHPVILVSGGDMARIIIKRELDVPGKFAAWIARIKEQASSG